MVLAHYNLRAASVPGWALDAVWVCHAALVQTAGSGPDCDGSRLADLLPDSLGVVHDTDLLGVVTVLERILAVLTLDLPGTDALLTRILLEQEVTPDNHTTLDEVRVAWRNAGVDG